MGHGLTLTLQGGYEGHYPQHATVPLWILLSWWDRRGR